MFRSGEMFGGYLTWVKLLAFGEELKSHSYEEK
jgi:hypothetical protein